MYFSWLTAWVSSPTITAPNVSGVTRVLGAEGQKRLRIFWRELDEGYGLETKMLCNGGNTA